MEASGDHEGSSASEDTGVRDEPSAAMATVVPLPPKPACSHPSRRLPSADQSGRKIPFPAKLVTACRPLPSGLITLI